MAFEEIFERIRQNRSLIATRRKNLSEASDSVSVLENRINEAEKSINTSTFAENLEMVKSKMKENNFPEAYRISKETLTDINSSLESWQPNIKLEIPSNIVPGKWTKSNLKISNEGNAHALSLSINFTDGIKQQGLLRVPSLKAGQSIDLEANLVTEFAGSVNIKANYSFSRKHGNKHYEVDFDEWIEIGESSSKPSKPSAPKNEVTLEHRDTVQDWIKPSDLAPDGETLLDLFTRRWACYSQWPDNVRELDYLHNNFRDVAISSYFEIPTDPTTVLSEWSLPSNLRKNVYLDDERASHILEVLNSKSDDNYVIIGEPGVGKTTLLFEIFDSFMDKVPTGILTTTGITNAHLEFGIRLFYDDIPENYDIVQSITENDTKGLVVTAREADWNKLSDEFQRKFKRLTVPLFSDENVSRGGSAFYQLIYGKTRK